MKVLATLGIAVACAGCHVVGEVNDVSFVDEVRCLHASDCVSGECQIPTCQDGQCGVVNVLGGEQCSSGVCDGQGLCQGCQVDADCPSGPCQSNQCVAETCANGDKDGDETGIDCGGNCAPCVTGQGCVHADDCAGGICVDETCEPCTENSDCPDDEYCHTSKGDCAPKKPLGADCEHDAECLDPYECSGDKCKVDAG